MKTCSKCKTAKPIVDFFRDSSKSDGLQCHCKSCERSRNRIKRQKYKEYFKNKDERFYKNNREKILENRRQWLENNKEKKDAHNFVKEAVKNGELVRKDCQECGSKDSLAHHPDYTKPLKVMWLCSMHHMRLHHSKD